MKTNCLAHEHKDSEKCLMETERTDRNLFCSFLSLYFNGMFRLLDRHLVHSPVFEWRLQLRTKSDSMVTGVPECCTTRLNPAPPTLFWDVAASQCGLKMVPWTVMSRPDDMWGQRLAASLHVKPSTSTSGHMSVCTLRNIDLEDDWRDASQTVSLCLLCSHLWIVGLGVKNLLVMFIDFVIYGSTLGCMVVAAVVRGGIACSPCACMCSPASSHRLKTCTSG